MSAPASIKTVLDTAESIERCAYMDGWRWGVFCGWVAGMLVGSALVGACMLLGQWLGPT